MSQLLSMPCHPHGWFLLPETFAPKIPALLPAQRSISLGLRRQGLLPSQGLEKRLSPPGTFAIGVAASPAH